MRRRYAEAPGMMTITVDGATHESQPHSIPSPRSFPMMDEAAR